MTVLLNKRAFTVEEYYKMAEAGILGRKDRVELIEGDIVAMTPIGSRHTACVSKLNRLLVGALEDDVIVRVQDPIRLDDTSEPEPDLAIVTYRADFYAKAHPTPRDVHLIIEVADTSLVYDQEVKISLYARAGIPEVWLINVAQPQVIVYAEPSEKGYGQVSVQRAGDALSAAVGLNLFLTVDEVLP